MHRLRTLLVSVLVSMAASIALAQDGSGDFETAKRQYRSGDFRAALETLERVVAVEESPEALYLIGYANLMLRDYEASREAFRRSFSLRPDFDLQNRCAENMAGDVEFYSDVLRDLHPFPEFM